MKKLISILVLVSLTTTTASGVIACDSKKAISTINTKRIPKIKTLQPEKVEEKTENLMLQQTNLVRNKRNINFEKELDVYQKMKKSITNFDNIKSKIISFFKDNYNKYYFITDDGLYILNKKNNKIIKINNINSSNIWYANFDSKNNLYFAMYSVSFGSSGGAVYVLKNGENTAQKINGINERIFNIMIDNNNNVYFDSNNGLYILKNGENTVFLCEYLKKYGFYKKTLGFDEKNNLYFTTLDNTYVLKSNVDIPTKINNLTSYVNFFVVNENNNVYFGTNNGAFVLKQGEATATKINEIKFLNKDDKVNYIWFDKKYIYIGCLYQTYILDYNYKIIKLIPSSHCLRYDKNGNIYFGSGRGIYTFNPNTMKYQKIKINKHNNLYDSDDEILNIYYFNRNIYFMEYTRQTINFYKINSNDIAEKIDNFNKILIK
ncbi:hypothetical protein [Spiroplasma endosymbiont of Megaselia nigra]|uniref:hypothetical protein n=1 Tax=Spiroplasma endosymbiont of Megaselia nigra TaxID=2478537 RepID=UPI000F884B35|nr:hypothetical protein [Spiroplasma endosymbiont of Megaselia nigra]RUO86151.1 hypothetical protein D9R21_04770 [Spiroplasma endosymbiont of Megaselia nigra]